ncbi:MAG TPA: neutral zinc metallopeptidase [Candidatus Krumholzibacteria bacterium]|nr:neutral zinc metallopeptidase [Candidatus Krumholzibacteria bacterium]
MKWAGRRQSGNVEDRRGMRPGRMALGGGLGTIVVLIIAALFGADPRDLIRNAPVQQTEENVPVDPAEEPLKNFVSVVLADTEDIWSQIFAQQNATYQKPWVVLYSEAVESACGFATAATGPFYCPPDQKVYIDLSFFEELQSRFGAKGDFAVAYVVAHEIGHHVQNMMGLTDQVHSMQGQVSQEEFNQMSVRLELQADYFAGVWAHHAQTRLKIIEPGDIEEAMGAAAAVGDDRIQKQTRGYVVPDAFTHGTSAQRVAWFRRGFESGDLSQGDTFNVRYDEL